MKSLPILEAIFVLCLFGAVAYPLHRLTGSAPLQAEVEAVEVPDRALVDGFVALRFAHPPLSVRMVDDDDRMVLEWENADAETRWDGAVQIVVEDSGYADLRIEAQWNEGFPETAVEVRIEPDAADTFVKTLWATGSLDTWMRVPIHE